MPVAAGNADAANVEFAGDTHGGELLVGIQDVDGDVGQGLAERDRRGRGAAHSVVGCHIGGGGDRRLGGAVGTEEEHGVVAQGGPGAQRLHCGLIAADQKDAQMRRET